MELYHIGSTAIPGIVAKPIIDLCLEASDLSRLGEKSAAMETLGYEVLGEFGIPQRRFFRRNDASKTPTHHVHAFPAGSSHVRRHVAFRDYLISHPAAAEAYGRLKLELAREHANDRDAYVAGKAPFITRTQAQAIEWSEQ